MSRRASTYHVGIGILFLVAAVQQACKPSSEKVVDRPASEAQWTVILTATGGELGKAIWTTQVSFKDGKAQAEQVTVDAEGNERRRVSDVSREAYTSLWKTIEAVDAWNLPDFERVVLDTPNYTIYLERGNRIRTVVAKGATGSEPHLKLILAIQQSAAEEGT